MDSINLVDIATLVLLTVYTVATVVLVRLTRSTVRETQRLTRAQTTPKVILYASDDPDRESILQLVVKNTGTAMAYDIRFDFAAPVPFRAWNQDVEKGKAVEPMTDGPLVEGIPTLGPGDCRRIDWGQYQALKKSLGEEPIHVTVRFTDGEEEMSPTRAVLEVDSFKRTPRIASNATKIARQLERIADVAQRFRWGPLRVQVEQPLEVGVLYMPPTQAGTGMSPVALKLAEHFARSSTNGQEFDPMIELASLPGPLDCSPEQAEQAVEELRGRGLVKVNGESPPSHVWPTDALFWQTDSNALADAKLLAIALAERGDGAEAKDIADALAWVARRLNPAATYLEAHGLARVDRALGEGIFQVSLTVAGQAFARS